MRACVASGVSFPLVPEDDARGEFVVFLAIAVLLHSLLQKADSFRLNDIRISGKRERLATLVQRSGNG